MSRLVLIAVSRMNLDVGTRAFYDLLITEVPARIVDVWRRYIRQLRRLARRTYTVQTWREYGAEVAAPLPRRWIR